MYRDKPLTQYIDDLAAKLPAPGGGSAAALTASCGAALISMVVNFTLGKPRYAEYENELKIILENSEKLRHEFLNLLDLDIAAYKSKDIRDALRVPVMVCNLCFEGIRLCPPLVSKGNVNLISDVAVAAILLESAFRSAYVNVEINLKSLGDKGFADAMRKDLSGKEEGLRKIKLETEDDVVKIIRG